jgi:hypothetical protein
MIRMSQKCLLTIKTHYATRPSSNVGKVVARLTNGMQRSVVINQALTPLQNATLAASKLAEVTGGGLILGEWTSLPGSGFAYEFELVYR